jgi:hypothetical protein
VCRGLSQIPPQILFNIDYSQIGPIERCVPRWGQQSHHHSKLQATGGESRRDRTEDVRDEGWKAAEERPKKHPIEASMFQKPLEATGIPQRLKQGYEEEW